jgi:hypothetical protein
MPFMSGICAREPHRCRPVKKEVLVQRWNNQGDPERPEIHETTSTEAVIVFEVRNSGDELAVAGKPDANALGNIQQIVDVITKLQLK